MTEKEIIDLFLAQNKEIKEHFNTQVRTLQEVHEVNHNSLLKEIKETKANTEVTNGRVNKIEDDLYGEKDVHGNIKKNQEGIVHNLNEIKKYRWFYKNWKIPVVIFLLTTWLFVKESRDLTIQALKFIKIF